MNKIDLKRDQRTLYAAPTGRWVDVTVPPMRYLAVDGHGDPTTAQAYRDAIAALFAAAYAARAASRQHLGRDYVVLPLEGLWWAGDMSTFRTREKDRWSWRMLIRQPDWVTDGILTSAIDRTVRTGTAAAGHLQLVTLDEGRCVQTLHVGSYDDETPTLTDLHDRYLPGHGLRATGRHHEIYLSDARRTPSAKLRTILRQPVADDHRPPVA